MRRAADLREEAARLVRKPLAEVERRNLKWLLTSSLQDLVDKLRR
jgi:hypothetical protein